MKDEIKEILGNINYEVEIDKEWVEPLCLDRDGWKLLLDYITNLQEELKSANDSITWWTNRFNAVQRDYEDYKSKCEKLELENKVLKEQMVAMVQPNYVYGIELQGVDKDE